MSPHSRWPVEWSSRGCCTPTTSTWGRPMPATLMRRRHRGAMALAAAKLERASSSRLSRARPCRRVLFTAPVSRSVQPLHRLGLDVVLGDSRLLRAVSKLYPDRPLAERTRILSSGGWNRRPGAGDRISDRATAASRHWCRRSHGVRPSSCSCQKKMPTIPCALTKSSAVRVLHQ